MHPSLDSVSVLMFTALPVCLFYGTKQMLHSVHIQTLWSVCTTHASTYSQISILSGKLYIAVPLRTSNTGYKLERHIQLRLMATG